MNSYHPTIESFFIAIKSNNVDQLESIFDENILFKPPTYWKEWQGKEVVARILSHVGSVFKNLELPTSYENYDIEKLKPILEKDKKENSIMGVYK